MAIYPRDDPRTALPQLEKKIGELQDGIDEINETPPCVELDYSHAYPAGTPHIKTGVDFGAGSGSYVGTSVLLAKVSDTDKRPILTGVDITGSGTSAIYLIGFYLTTTVVSGETWWAAYVKARNSGSSAISGATVTAYVIWVKENQ